MMRPGRLLRSQLAAVALVITRAACSGEAQEISRSELGRALYQGYRPWALAEKATNLGLPVEFSACGGCHGRGGKGSSEAGVLAPALNWTALLRQNREGPGYRDADAVLQAVEHGTGRGGRELRPVMPRFNLTGSEKQALLAYLQVLGSASDKPVGVEDDAIRIGTLLPLKDEFSDIGRAVRTGLQQSIANVNRDGGVYGRKLELIVEPVALEKTSIRQGLERLLNEKRVYALVASFTDLDDKQAFLQLEETLASARVADIAPLSQPLDTVRSDNNWRAPMFSALDEQGQLLKQSLQRACMQGARGMVLVDSQRLVATGDREDLEYDDPQFLLQELQASSAHGNLASQPFRVVSLAGRKSTRALLAGLQEWRQREQQRDRPLRACIGYLPFEAGLSLQWPADWVEVLVSPVPRETLEQARSDGTGVWQVLGQWAGQVLVEALAQAGPVLNERALLEALPAVNGRMPSGVRLNYRLDHLHALQATAVVAGSANNGAGVALQDTHW